MVTYAHIVGWGKYVPPKVMTNYDLSKIVDTSDEWITERTGIKRRHIVAQGESTSDLAYRAGRAALEDAGLEPRELDFVLVCTFSPDYITPATACAAATLSRKTRLIR